MAWLCVLLAPAPTVRAIDAVLSKVKDVLALPVESAEAGAQPVKLRGVITYVTARGDECALHDGTGCIPIHLDSSIATPALGADVEVEGSVAVEPFFERKRLFINAAKFAMLGTKPLPEGTPASIDDVSGFKRLDQWVSVEGTVTQVRSSMSLFTIQLATDAASCNVLVRDWPRDGIPRNWIGGRVRVLGLNRAYLPGSNFFTVTVPSPAQVTVIKEGVADPLDAPAASVLELSRRGISSQTRVKLSGTLLGATTGNVYYVRTDDGGAFSFYALHPIDEDKSGRFSTPIIVPAMKTGDVLEVTGIPGRTQPGVHLNFGVVRVVKSGPEPVATPADIATINGGGHIHDLVEAQGRLVSIDDVLVAPGRWRTTMKLESDGESIVAFLDAPSRGALAGLETNHLLRVRGIVTGPPHFPKIRLWVRTPSDLQSLGVAKETETRRLWTGLGIAALVVIMLSGWVLFLGRSRAAVREANASLEARVSERTAELATAKDELARALSQERELGELKTRFVSLVSHEFRTPLGVTMSAVELLRHFGNKLTPEKHEELYQDIHSATLQMSGLMEQVLLLGRAEAGKLDWRPAPVDLPDLCGRLTDEALSATNSRCPVNFTSEGDFAGAMMDSALLRHIVSNLLSNAVKYSPEGSPVSFRVGRDGEEIVLAVQDKGIGIPEADKARLFEAFHRAANVGETPGTGLGLLLVRRCVELQHGTISVESQEGAGTTFTVRLPMGNDHRASV